MSTRLAAWIGVMALAPALASSQTREGLRTELAAFEAALDQAVQKVSRPGSLHLLGDAAGVRRGRVMEREVDQTAVAATLAEVMGVRAERSEGDVLAGLFA